MFPCAGTGKNPLWASGCSHCAGQWPGDGLLWLKSQGKTPVPIRFLFFLQSRTIIELGLNYNRAI